MQPDTATPATESGSGWITALGALAAAALAVIVAAREAWSEMIALWWNVDTYSHILLIPPIIAWLVWLRRDVLAPEEPRAWWPGLILTAAACGIWLAGSVSGVNLVAHVGAAAMLASLVPAILGLRVALLLALPLAYAVFLVPFGHEVIPPLQHITAEIAVALTRLSGVPAVVDGIHIDTPAGLFIVAEACSGVQFLVAMVALGTLAAMTGFNGWKRRILFLLACVIVPIIANGIRAWATIYIAQYVGAEAAGSFDHIVYGWIFFGIVIAIVLGLAWRWFDRTPEEAGWSREEIAAMPLAGFGAGQGAAPLALSGIAIGIAILFAVAARLV